MGIVAILRSQPTFNDGKPIKALTFSTDDPDGTNEVDYYQTVKRLTDPTSYYEKIIKRNQIDLFYYLRTSHHRRDLACSEATDYLSELPNIAMLTGFRRSCCSQESLFWKLQICYMIIFHCDTLVLSSPAFITTLALVKLF